METTDLHSLAGSNGLPGKARLESLEPMWVSYLLGGRHGDSDTQGPSRRALFSAAMQRREGREVCGVFTG